MLLLELRNLDVGIFPIISIVSLLLSMLLLVLGILSAILSKGDNENAKQLIGAGGVMLLIGLGTCGIGFAMNS